MSAPAMEPQALSAAMRLAMRRLGSTVSVVTACKDGVRHAMTATSLTSLSMDPPSLLVCVNQSTTMHAALQQAQSFCVNILSSEQRDVAAACGGKAKGDERFLEGQWAVFDSGLPYLVNAQASIVCMRDQTFAYGTHSLFIGRVGLIRTRERIDPLVYLDGGYFEARALPTSGPEEFVHALAAALPPAPR